MIRHVIRVGGGQRCERDFGGEAGGKETTLRRGWWGNIKLLFKEVG